MPINSFGRPRTLDRNKKQLFCDAISRGATMTEAAVAVGVSLRTVQREARLDPHFDQQLRLAHTDKPDPLAIMQSAARSHWRAAAWLLERTKPEDYGRRPASSCSPYQFEEALKVVIDAALRLAPLENHARVYAELTAASETAFKAVFPNYGPYGRRLVKRLPDTPLANAQRLEVLRNPPPNRIVGSAELVERPDPLESAPPVGWVDRAAATHHTADPYAAPYLHPRALPEAPPAAQEVVATNQTTPGPTLPLPTIEEVAPVTPSSESEESRPPVESTSPPPSAPEGRGHGATGASPWTDRVTKRKPQRGDIAPASRPSSIRRRSGRVLRPIASRTAPTFRKGRRILSPKTRVATKLYAGDKPSRNWSQTRAESAGSRLSTSDREPSINSSGANVSAPPAS